MGYYDEDAHGPSDRSDMEDESDRAATDSSQNFEGGGHFTTKLRDGNPVQADPLPTLTVPCHHIRLGDFLILQGRPCQVIKISTSAATGQYRYLGVDLFTKKLHEAVSVTSYPAPSVVVQTMLSPVFKQYRVVDLADGHVTAMTEAGDVKQRLPVIDQSNVWSRLKQAFESGRGSVRVIVLSTMENGDLAVDVKVIYGSSLAERQPGQPGFDLHALARDGDLWMLQDALETKPNINKLDSYGRSALFYAVENRHIKTVFALLDAEANLNIVDSSGKTALDLAVRLAGSDRDMVAVAEMFLRRGALPMEAINPQVLGLLSASARGDSAIVAHILRQNPPINDTDRLGYTALHEAACFGRYDVAELLIKNKADLSARVTLGDDGVLHAVVERREHRRFLGNDRKDPPDFGKDHVRVVELLLRHGALASQRRWQDGKTVQDVILGKLKSAELGPTERFTLQQTLMILRSYSPGKANFDKKTGPQSKPTSPPPNPFQLKVQHYPPKPEEDPKEVKIEEFVKQPGSVSRGSTWRWIHLPKTNKVWVENVIGALSGLNDHTLQAYLNGSKAFIDDAYDEIQCPAHHPGIRRPSFVPFHKSHDEIFSLVVPYFNAESLECLKSQAEASSCQNEKCKTDRSTEKALKEFYNKADGLSKSWHEPCTLDQSYYVFLQDEDTSRRNEGQVVAKHANRPSGQGKHERNILMVNQMWIWKIDSETIVTAFPNCRRDHGKDDKNGNLSARISEAIRQDPPQSAGSLILLMMQCAIEFVDAPTNCGLGEDVLHIFNQSIASQAEKETVRYGNFDAAQQKNAAILNAETRNDRDKDEDQMCDIGAEIMHLREVKDIKDELRMVERVFSDQRLVINRYRAIKGGLPQSEKDDLERLKEGLGFRISRVRELLEDARSVELSLNYLLDIKQKRGNLRVTINTRRLADQADERARDGEWQTQLLFIFTIITVIFTPISFVCALFAVPSQDFPNNGEGDVAWAWWQVLVAGLLTELVTFVTIAAFWFKSPRKSTGGTAAPAADPLRSYHVWPQRAEPLQQPARGYRNV